MQRTRRRTPLLRRMCLTAIPSLTSKWMDISAVCVPWFDVKCTLLLYLYYLHPCRVPYCYYHFQNLCTHSLPMLRQAAIFLCPYLCRPISSARVDGFRYYCTCPVPLVYPFQGCVDCCCYRIFPVPSSSCTFSEQICRHLSFYSFFVPWPRPFRKACIERHRLYLSRNSLVPYLRRMRG